MWLLHIRDKDICSSLDLEIFKSMINVKICISEKEREDQLENLKKDIANIIVQKCINKNDSTSFPVSIIMKAMAEVNCKINPIQSAKKQALEFVKDL